MGDLLSQALPETGECPLLSSSVFYVQEDGMQHWEEAS